MNVNMLCFKGLKLYCFSLHSLKPFCLSSDPGLMVSINTSQMKQCFKFIKIKLVF